MDPHQKPELILDSFPLWIPQLQTLGKRAALNLLLSDWELPSGLDPNPVGILPSEDDPREKRDRESNPDGFEGLPIFPVLPNPPSIPGGC